MRFPLSFAQQRLWFLAQMDKESATYNIPLALRLSGDLDGRAWRQSLDRLIARHEALRSVFPSEAGEPHVLLLPATTRFTLIEHDLVDAREAAERLEQLMDEEQRAPFDLAKGPLIRGRLIRLAAREHVFLLTQHHIVSDWWSMGVLTNELSRLYTAFASGAADPLPPLEIQYPDYAAWQRKWLVGGRLDAQKEYWRRTLADAPAMLEVPTDRPRPPTQSYAGGFVAVELDDTLTKGVKRLSQQHGTTLFMTLMTAWALVLARVSGQDRVMIGTPSANRNRRELEPLIGFFVNTLALKIDTGGARTVTELLERVRQTTLEAQQHQDLSFDKVVEVLQPERRLDQTTLFQAMFAWQSSASMRLELPTLSIEQVMGSSAHAKFDIQLRLREARGRIVGALLYATALFDAATIERHREYFLAAVRAMVADCNCAIDAIDVIPPSERRLLLETWNDTRNESLQFQAVHSLVEQAAGRSPEKIAIEQRGHDPLTYRQLDDQAAKLARVLALNGVGREARVAVCAKRHPSTVVAFLAIWKAGAAYVPLDPTHPRERLRDMLADADPAVVLSDAAGREALGDTPLPHFTLGAAGHEEPTRAALPDVQPNQPAYLMYTSGSTGKPKGVVVEHAAVHNRLAWMKDAFHIDDTDVVLQKSPLGFDVSAWEIFLPLVCGARLVLAPDDMEKEPQALAEMIAQDGITTVHFVPSMLDAFIESASVSRCTGLKRLICAGEMLPDAMVRRCKARLAGTTIFNVYGPSEAPTSSAHECDDGAVSIGRPIANTRLYVLDRLGHLVPRGSVGELYVAGAGLARGYWKQPEATARRFVPDPYSQRPGARMYRTGDVVRHLVDGTLQFLGRSDDQVKIRGHRIELAEIECRLREHDLVRETVVIAREHDLLGKHLIAYFTTAENCSEAEAATMLRGHLADRLPEYMIPAAYVRLEAIPTTSNGKLDRRLLAQGHEAHAQGIYEAPKGDVEETLARLWSELLDVARVGRHDHFFELGGHSLLVVRLVDKLEQAGLRVDIRQVFESPTLVKLAEVITGTSEPDRTAVLPVRRTGSQSPLFFVPTGIGDHSYVFELARELDRDFPVYALPWEPSEQMVGLTMEAMAARMVSRIRATNPHGPYRLAGYSLGGVLAYGTAQALLEVGEQVSFLGLIDVRLPGSVREVSPERALIDYYAYQPEFMTQDASLTELEWLSNDLPLRTLVQEGQRLGWLNAAVDAQEHMAQWRRVSSFFNAVVNYRAPALPLTIFLYRAIEDIVVSPHRLRANPNSGVGRSPWLGWERVVLTGAVRSIPSPGNHGTMMSDGACRKALGRLISSSLSGAI